MGWGSCICTPSDKFIYLLNIALQLICVRDCITVRADGDEDGEKPYVGKIASLWRESAGTGHILYYSRWARELEFFTS